MVALEKIIGNEIESVDSLILPYSLKVYKDNIYVVDRLTHSLYKYDLNGYGGAIIK